jgi:hypothetical protein
MPDFRKTIDDAKFKPEMTTISTTGPNAEGVETTWQNPNKQLTQSSAEELANLMGAKLVPISYNAGPYSQDKPQYQLDFGDGDLHDASMVYSNYQRNPDSFNQQMQDEFKSSAGPSVAQAEFDAGKLGGHPSNPGADGGGTSPNSPGPKWPDAPNPNTPGPKWPDAPPPNVSGPVWKLPELPVFKPTGPAVVPVGDSGVANPGGYTPPPMYQGQFPLPINLNDPEEIKRRAAAGLLTNTQQRRGGGLLG